MSFRLLVERHVEVDTTMAVARRRAQEGAPTGTTVLAEVQRAGRGRLGRTWFSPRGSLTATVILRPGPRPDGSPLPLVGLVAGVAAREAVRALGVEQAMLKWPNDIVVGKEVGARKLGGILVEADAVATAEPVVLIGFGLNVAAGASLELPEELRRSYAGIADLVGRKTKVEAVLAVLLDAVERWYGRWLSEGAAGVLAAWRAADALLGVEVNAEGPAGPVVGRADGVTDSGALRIVTPGGVVELIAGDVVRVQPATEA